MRPAPKEPHPRPSPVLNQPKKDSTSVHFTLPTTHPRQHEFITAFETHDARFVVAACGTKFGKTYGSCIWLCKQAWNMPNSVNWWIAPSYSQSKIGYDLAKRMLPKGTFIEYKADMRLTILRPDGEEHSRIEFKTAVDEATLRGFPVNNFVLDEASRVSKDSFLSVLTTVTQTEGKGIIVSTPKGRGWFYDAYQRGEKFYPDGTPKYSDEYPDPDPQWFSIRLPTHMNPYVKPKAIEDARKIATEDEFRQEYLAMFIDDSAGVFKGVSACTKGTDFERPRPGHLYVGGLDLARLNDYTVLTIMDRNRHHVVYQEQIRQTSWDYIYSRIVFIANMYKAPICTDSSGLGDPIVERLQNMGAKIVPYKIRGSASKQELIDKLKLGIERGDLSYPANRVTNVMMEELRSYEYTISDRGVTSYSAPRGKHDDCVISLSMAYWLVDQPVFKYHYLSVPGV